MVTTSDGVLSRQLTPHQPRSKMVHHDHLWDFENSSILLWSLREYNDYGLDLPRYHFPRRFKTSFDRTYLVAREARVTEADVKATLTFCSNVNELFQIMNGKKPITWTESNDPHGVVIGLRDQLDTTHGFTLNWFSKQYGVSVKTLMESSGLPNGSSIPAHGSVLIIDRLKRLKEIADYFKTWKEQIDTLHGYTKAQRSRMFITHWLYTDLRRTCYSTIELMNHYVTKSSRRWVLRRFTLYTGPN